MNKKYIIIGIIVILIIAGIIAITSKSKSGDIVKEPATKEFTIKAFRFGYDPDIITVNKGDKVKIKIDNTDTTHGIRIPDYDLKDKEVVEFTADKIGEFEWYCANYCGEEHMSMKGKLIVK